MARATKANPHGLTIPQDDWQPAKLDDQGREVDEHGLPTNTIQRAMVLAEQGKSDPAGIVTDEQIAALDPEPARKDQEAVAEYRIKRDWGEEADADTLAESTVNLSSPEALADPAGDGGAGANSNEGKGE